MMCGEIRLIVISLSLIKGCISSWGRCYYSIGWWDSMW